VVNEGHLVSERLRTLRGWICVYPRHDLFKANAAGRTAPYICDHIAAPEEAHDLRHFHLLGCSTMRLAPLSMYNELVMGTSNHSPHVFAMCDLVLGLEHSQRLRGIWANIGTVSDRHHKDVFISENLPPNIPDMVSQM
jgi:hypothetical protein